MKFRFPLSTLLKYRERLERDAQVQYAEAKNKVDEALNQINQMYQLLDRTRLEIQEFQKLGDEQVQEIQIREEFILGLKVKIDQARQKARDLMMIAEEKHHELLEAVRDFKTLDTLKDKHHQEFVRRQKKQELKKIDELVTMRHKRGFLR